MKKKLLISMLGCCAVFFLFTAFDSGNATQAEQVQKMQDMLGERLDAFRVAKEQECKDRALEVAATRADSMMNASSKKTVRRKPTYTKKGSDVPKVVAPTPPPAPPAPAPAPAPKDVTRDVQKTATTSGKKTDAAKKAVQDAAREVQKKATTTGKKRSGN